MVLPEGVTMALVEGLRGGEVGAVEMETLLIGVATTLGMATTTEMRGGQGTKLERGGAGMLVARRARQLTSCKSSLGAR